MDSLHSRQSFCSLCWLPQESPESQQVNSSQAVVMLLQQEERKIDDQNSDGTYAQSQHSSNAEWRVLKQCWLPSQLTLLPAG